MLDYSKKRFASSNETAGENRLLQSDDAQLGGLTVVSFRCRAQFQSNALGVARGISAYILYLFFRLLLRGPLSSTLDCRPRASTKFPINYIGVVLQAPILLGEGLGFFGLLESERKLSLIKSETFVNGMVDLWYECL